LRVVTRFDRDVAPTQGRGRHRREPDAPRAHHCDAFPTDDGARRHAVHRHPHGLDETRVLDGEAGWERDEGIPTHQYPLGGPAVAAHTEDHVVAAEMPEPTRAQCARAALVARVDRDGRAVVEHTGELVPEGPGLWAIGEHVKVAAADARGLHV